jgi:hypothetical protein
MPWVAVTVLIVGLVTAVGQPARARECFCLSHATGAILRGCEAFKAPTDFYPTAICTDPETGKRSKQTMYSDWNRIEAGADRCDPCRRVTQGIAPELPRGDNGALGPRR